MFLNPMFLPPDSTPPPYSLIQTHLQPLDALGAEGEQLLALRLSPYPVLGRLQVPATLLAPQDRHLQHHPASNTHRHRHRHIPTLNTHCCQSDGEGGAEAVRCALLSAQLNVPST